MKPFVWWRFRCCYSCCQAESAMKKRWAYTIVYLFHEPFHTWRQIMIPLMRCNFSSERALRKTCRCNVAQSKLRGRRRQREHHVTKGLTSKTTGVHVRYKYLYISLPFYAKQQGKMTTFCVVWALGGGEYSLIWAIKVCAALKGMVFQPFWS